MPTDRKQTILMVLLLFAAVVVCYGGTLNSGFVWDDEFLVVNNPVIRAPILSLEVFRQDIICSSFTTTLYYRPLQILSYAVEYRLWGMDPAGFHASNLLLHFFNSVLVLLLFRRMFRDIVPALVASVIFAVHPVYSGAVSYVSSRTDLLLFFFALLSILCHMRYREKGGWGALVSSGAFYIMALLSKEAALILPLVVLVADRTVVPAGRGKGIPPLIMYSSITVAYLAGHIVFLPSAAYPRVMGMSGSRDLFTRYAVTVSEFIKIFFMPTTLYMRRTMSPDTGSYISLAGAFSAAAALFLCRREARRPLVFSCGFFLVAAVPFVFVSGYFRVAAEHWIYLPSVGLLGVTALVFTVGLRSGRKILRRLTFAVVLFCVAYLGYKSSVEALSRGSDESLSDKVLSSSSTDAPALHFKALSRLREGDEEATLELMEQYVRPGERDPRAYYIRGRMRLAAGKTEEAVRDFRQALEIDRGYDSAVFGMAMVSFIRGDRPGGIVQLEKAVAMNPRNSEAYLFLSAAYSEEGMPDKALRTAREAYRLSPYDLGAIINLGTALSRAGDIRGAAALYYKACELYPESALAAYDLGSVLYAGGQPEEASRWLKRALELDPAFTKARELLRETGKDVH